MNIKKCIAVILLAFLTLSQAAWASSRSATIRVSCTILPALQLSSLPLTQAALGSGSRVAPFDGNFTPAPRPDLTFASQGRQIRVNGNLNGQFRVNQTTTKTGQNSLTLYSVTAL